MQSLLLQFIASNETELIAAAFGLLGVVIGGAFTLAGTLASPWIELKLARRRRMEDEMASHRIIASAEAYKQLRQLIALCSGLIPAQLEDAAIKVNLWFDDHRLFLPGKFPSKWLHMRKIIHEIYQIHLNSGDEDRRIGELRRKAGFLGTEALLEITKDLGLEEIEPDNP